MLGEIPETVDLERFDVIVVHYTLVACNERFLSARSRERLRACRALKAMFIQDEYRHVNDSMAAMRDIDIKLLFTCVPESEIQKVYSKRDLPEVRMVNVLTGYVSESLLRRPTRPPSQRRLLVGYRGRRVPFWLGALGEEKYVIGVRFLKDAARYPDLECDISFREEDRLYGDRWTEFLASCRAVLGVESGASVFDFSGELQRAVERDVRLDPTLGFDELSGRHFSHLDGVIKLNQISPRCFEAAALRTVMVLYPGEYSHRLEPWRHYIPLEKDHSNMDEVVNALRDGKVVDEMTERAFQEVALAPENGYAAFAKRVDEALQASFEPSMAAIGAAYDPAELARLSVRDYGSIRRRVHRAAMTYAQFFVFRVLFGWVKPASRERLHRRLKWIYHTITLYEWRSSEHKG